MSDRINYQIAKDYLLKLPEKEREELCKSVLKNLQGRKESVKEIKAEYKEFLSRSKCWKDFKKKYNIL